MEFERHIDSSVVEVSVKLKERYDIETTILVASRLPEILW